MYFRQDFKTFISEMPHYDFAIIDPPWNYYSKPYAVMRNQLTYNLWDNKDLEYIFNNIDCDYLFIWVTNSMIPELFEYSKNSMFVYKTLFTWVKTTSKNNIAYGLGNTFRNCTEHIAVFQKKKSKPLNMNIRNCILAEKGKRTVKPKNIEKLIVDIMHEKNKSGVYIFSGKDLDFIDCVDIV